MFFACCVLRQSWIREWVCRDVGTKVCEILRIDNQGSEVSRGCLRLLPVTKMAKFWLRVQLVRQSGKRSSVVRDLDAQVEVPICAGMLGILLLLEDL